ncbi:hypothetical protein BJX64DRAFT_291610 [Aspergillus heterothallicus]
MAPAMQDSRIGRRGFIVLPDSPARYRTRRGCAGADTHVDKATRGYVRAAAGRQRMVYPANPRDDSVSENPFSLLQTHFVTIELVFCGSFTSAENLSHPVWIGLLARMEDFLNSIPVVQKLLQSESERQRPTRDDIFHDIREALQEKLDSEKEPEDVSAQARDQPLDLQEDIDPENDDQKWFEQLAELDLGEANDSDVDDKGAAPPNSIDSMAYLLTRYIVNRPWIPMPALEPKLDEQSRDTAWDPALPPVQTGRDNRSILSYDNLAELLACNLSDDTPRENNMIHMALNEQHLTRSKSLDIIAASDRRLGLAGFLPFIQQRTSVPEPPGLGTRHQDDESEDNLMYQWRSHTRVQKDCAKVCFHPYMEYAEFSPYILECIERNIKSIISQIDVLSRIEGYPTRRLHFILVKTGPSWAPRVARQHHAEIGEMDVELIRSLANVFETIKGTLLSYFVHGGIFVRFHLTLVLPPLFPLWSAVEPVLKTLGITRWNWMNVRYTEPTPFKVLHYTALAIQFVSLIVQSHLRGQTVPFRFQFLTTAISNFVLEGADSSPGHYLGLEKIYASSQKLSCLGDMLKQDVLVFTLVKGDLDQQPMDIVATPAQLAKIWGPAELIVRNSGRDSMSIVAIRMHKGILLPTGTSEEGIQKWHWEAEDSADARVPLTEISTGVDLHTKLRIGARDFLGFRAIGPARLNERCPRHGLEDFVFDNILSQSLRPMGTRDPGLEWQAFNFGLQGGQGAIFTAQGTLAKKPGVAAKEGLLNFSGLFSVRLAELDKMWGLVVSLCTGVMTRVRLRDLVAFYCLTCSPGDIPGMQGQKNRNDALRDFAQAMYGHSSLNTWVESVLPPPSENCYRRTRI